MNKLLEVVKEVDGFVEALAPHRKKYLRIVRKNFIISLGFVLLSAVCMMWSTDLVHTMKSPLWAGVQAVIVFLHGFNLTRFLFLIGRQTRELLVVTHSVNVTKEITALNKRIMARLKKDVV